MNKTAIKNFAVWARNKLIADITYKAGLIGVSEKGVAQPLPQSSKDLQFFDIGTKDYAQVAGSDIEQRNALVRTIQEKERTSDYKTAFKAVIEEVAYTWFNRLIAIRFMEVNDYLPSRIRVLSSENPAKNEPDFVTTPFDTDMEFTMAEQDIIIQLKDENKLDELFRILFIKQCNKLHEILPELFEETNNYTELLLSISFTDKDGVVYHLVHDIAENDFDVEKEGQVEIIGWMYQYYISEKHEEVIDTLHGKTIKKEDIPAATQLFTTDWVVRYMVDNALGRYWIERHPESNLADKLDFFVTPKDGKITYINEKIEPEELTFFDPCMGSGHILVYAFDVLMEIYRECGYTDRDAALSILENNLFGLDIDQRAYQLAYFAVMMKARSYNRRLFSRDVKCNIAAINESNGINKFTQANVTLDRKQNEIGEYLIDVFRHAKEIGSLQTVVPHDYDTFSEYVDSCEVVGQMDLFSAAWSMHTAPLIRKLINQAKILSRKYTVVCTNPPYMNKMESHLKDFVTANFKSYSGDLFSVFMHRNFGFCTHNGYSAFMTPNVWMFTKSYELLRNSILSNHSITTLIQMAKGAFYKEATVDICSFVLCNKKSSAEGTYIRLERFKGDMDVQREYAEKAINDPECDYFFSVAPCKFEAIEGTPIAYWISEKTRDIFKNNTLKAIASPCIGMRTGDNARFLRQWHEVLYDKIGIGYSNAKMAQNSGKKWFPYNKGGAYRRWYGNNELVVNWEDDGAEIKAETRRRYPMLGENLSWKISNEQFYFRNSISWSDTTSAAFSGRYSDCGALFDVKGSSCFPTESDIYYVIGLLNTKITQEIISILNPTITTQVGDMARIPTIIEPTVKERVEELSKQNIAIARADWDSFETSWDFTTHPLVLAAQIPDDNGGHIVPLPVAFDKWEKTCERRFQQVKANEEELNSIFISIYGLQDELTSCVEDKDVTIRKAELSRDVRSLLSYAVGCMFGRYSLDEAGLIYAGGEWDDNKYPTFSPDKDNCIPITDEAYFEDDIVGQFVDWMKKAFGEDNLEANLDFIAKALGNKGTTSREVIRNYFLNDFMKDHIKIYQKRPIYWLFDSGKQNGFKALVYMHRWNADTVGNLRVEYLHKMQHTYEREIVRMQESIDNSRDSREVSKATKRKDKLQKQLKETKDYDAKLAHIALSRIEIDLDDGVKVNYEKVQTGRDGKKMQILAKI